MSSDGMILAIMMPAMAIDELFDMWVTIGMSSPTMSQSPMPEMVCAT
jgi:hypothetical protein